MCSRQQNCGRAGHVPAGARQSGRSDPERPGFLRLDDPALGGGQDRVAGEPGRKLAGEVARGENLRHRAHLRLVVRRTVAWDDLPAPPGRPNLGEHDRGVRGTTEAGFERPDAGAVGPARIVAQASHDRDAGQGLAADGTGISELPAGLRPDHPSVDQAAFFQSVRFMQPVVLGAEKLAGVAGRTAPERKSPVGNPAVQQSADREPVAAVLVVVLDQPGEFVPHGAPRQAVEAEPGGEARGIAEREIEADDRPFAACCNVRQDVGQQQRCGVSGGGVFAALAMRSAVAHPDAVAAGLRLVRRAPIDDDIMVEPQKGASIRHARP
jgi:hypothetical protein